MQSSLARKARPLIFALLLALGGASPALAASTSSGTSESFVIPATITLTGVPATATYAVGPLCSGSCLPSDFAYLITWVGGSNNATGFTASVSASTLTVGASTIPSSVRRLSVGSTSGWSATSGGFHNTVNGTPVAIGSTGAQGSVTVPMEPILRLNPNDYPAGAYAGTFTLALSTNP